MNIHCLQHISFENPGSIKDWALENHHTITYTYFFEDNFILPDLNNIDALIIMGGNMNAVEDKIYPWLTKEKELIKAAIKAHKKVIGICLGAQLITAALGGKVYPNNEKEIGFFPIQFIDDVLSHPFFNHFKNPYTVFHWHGDTFDLPYNTQLIASSAVCKHQAFLIGNNVMGLQFHFEMTETIIEDMILHDGNELTEEGKYIQSKAQLGQHYPNLQQNKKDFFTLLDKFFA
jgi:GMP synthase (glutamine-hydrolysing)